MLLSDPPSHYTTKEDTLQHEAYNFRHSIFTHKYDTLFFYKIAGQPPSKHTKTICHTGEKYWLKRLSDGGQELGG